jgi:hypothetical protein
MSNFSPSFPNLEYYSAKFDKVREYIGTNVLNNSQCAFIAQLAVKGMALLGLGLDLKQGEKYEWTNQITEHTLEDGSEISDNIINKSFVIEQRFILSAMNTFGIPGIVKLAPINTLLMELRKTKQIIRVLTTYGLYKNMVIESLSTTIMDGVENTFICDIRFREINFGSVTSSTVSATTQVQKTINTKNITFNVASAETKSGNIYPSRV